jgi:ribose/xylose/arabinose/galactoside ABC-type transport system permease subunit
MGRFLVTLGIVLVVAGIAWPWLAKLGFGRLPGDFRFEREGFTFYFPFTSGLIVSALLSLIVWLFRK